MSASPSQPNGHAATPTGSTPTDQPQILRRKKRPVDPLVSRKRPVPHPVAAKPKPAPGSTANGLIALGAKERRDSPTTSVSEQELRAFQAQKVVNGGWTDPPPQAGSYKEYNLVATQGSVLKEAKFHIMRFTRPNRAEDTGKFNVDPTDQDEWPRPITLNRRDPRSVTQIKQQQPKEETPDPNAIDPAETERLEKQKAEREAQRAIDLAQIAPVVKETSSKPKPKRKEEGTVSRYSKDTAEAKKQSQLRYQEAYPWVMEDAESKNTWIGRREAPLSEVNVALIVQGDHFRMLPLEGYYKFAAKQKFTTYNLAEAENQMKKRVQPPRWILTEQEEGKKKEKEYNEYREFVGGRQRVKMESATSRAAPKSERNDEYEIEMDGEEFQDDDENPGFEADDENERDTKGRVRREQLGANLFGDGDEDEVEKEEQDKQLEKLRRKLEGKVMKKALKKREKAFEYETESDSDDENPFSDSSSDDDSDDDDKNKEKDKDKDKDKGADGSKEKTASGANSKGNNTPSGKSKAPDGLKKGKKRPGSPGLSEVESSGSESTRKKGIKKARTGANTSVTASRSATPMPGAQKAPGGAASDGEATAGEMSDGGRKRKIKLVGTGAKGTPVGSRAGSPVPSAAKGVSPATADTSKPGTPAGSPPPSNRAAGIVEAHEIIELLRQHPEGLSIGQILKNFVQRVGDSPGQMPKNAWVTLVRQNSAFGKDKLLRMKTEKPSSPKGAPESHE